MWCKKTAFGLSFFLDKRQKAKGESSEFNGSQFLQEHNKGTNQTTDVEK